MTKSHCWAWNEGRFSSEIRNKEVLASGSSSKWMWIDPPSLRASGHGWRPFAVRLPPANGLELEILGPDSLGCKEHGGRPHHRYPPPGLKVQGCS